LLEQFGLGRALLNFYAHLGVDVHTQQAAGVQGGLEFGRVLLFEGRVDAFPFRRRERLSDEGCGLEHAFDLGGERLPLDAGDQRERCGPERVEGCEEKQRGCGEEYVWRNSPKLHRLPFVGVERTGA
jgi:hypothetical protein